MPGNPFPPYGYPVVAPDVATIKGVIKAYQPVFVNVSGAYNPVWSAADLQYLTLTGNASIGPVLAPGGAMLLFVFKQDATGGRTVTWDASFQAPIPNVDPTPNAITVVMFCNAWTSTAPVWTPVGTPGATRFVQKKITAGSYVFNKASTTTWYEIDSTNLRATLNAKVGDRIVTKMHAFWNNENVFATVDAASIVSGSPVNWWGASGGTGDFVPGMYAAAGAQAQNHVALDRILVAGDISGGQVTVSPFVRVGTVTSNKTLFAITSIPFYYSIENKGPVIAP